MLTSGQLINVKCEICHENAPNSKCTTCTFVICSNCNQELVEFKLSKSCPGCRASEPWITDIDPILKNRVNIIQDQNLYQTPNEYHNSYECNIGNQILKNIKFFFFRIIYFLLFVLFLISIGIIVSLIDKNFNNVQEMPLFSRILMFLFIGFLTIGIICIVFLLLTLFYVACIKCDNDALSRNRVNLV